MVRDAALSVRVTPELKASLEQAATNSGVSLASYVERALEVHSAIPKWTLADPEVFHSTKTGTTTIKLDVATGWPVALLEIKKAEDLGNRLLEAAKAAKRLSK